MSLLLSFSFSSRWHGSNGHTSSLLLSTLHHFYFTVLSLHPPSVPLSLPSHPPPPPSSSALFIPLLFSVIDFFPMLKHHSLHTTHLFKYLLFSLPGLVHFNSYLFIFNHLRAHTHTHCSNRASIFFCEYGLPRKYVDLLCFDLRMFTNTVSCWIFLVHVHTHL